MGTPSWISWLALILAAMAFYMAILDAVHIGRIERTVAQICAAEACQVGDDAGRYGSNGRGLARVYAGEGASVDRYK